jgi:hypothetical protein
MQSPLETSVQVLRNTRLAEGLRMDGRTHSSPPHEFRVRLGSKSAPIIVDVRRPADSDDQLVVPARNHVGPAPTDLLRESSLVVYCGNEQQVREGFTLALRAMGVEVDHFHEDIALPKYNLNR